MAVERNLPQDRDDPRNVTISYGDPRVTTVVTLDDSDTPTLTAGWGGWEEEPRARRRGLLVYTGPPAWRMRIPVILDAVIARGRAADRVARQWDSIMALMQIDAPDPPPLATLSGAALPRQGRDWALLEFEQTQQPMRNVDTGELLRWQGALTFGQVAARDVVSISGPGQKPGQIYTWRKNDTLRRVAQRKLGDARRWREITRLNGDAIRDPSKLKPGDKVRIPPK